MSNEAKIGDRIAVLKEELDLEANSDLEKGRNFPKERLLSNGLIADWLEKPIGWSSDKLEKFLDHYGIDRVWWKTGEGSVFIAGSSEKPTSMPNGAAIQQNSISQDAARLYAELYEKFLGANSQYLVIHRDVLKDHRLVAIEQYAEDKERLIKDRADMEKRSEEIQSLLASLREIATRPININFTDVQRTKE